MHERTAPRFVRVAAMLFVGVMLAESVLPLATATYKTFGEVVDASSTSSDKDITHLLLITTPVAPGVEVKFDDADTDGTVDSNEGVYVDADGSGTISATDIRIRTTTGISGGSKGEQVKASDADCCGTALSAAPGSWGYVDDFPALVGGLCVAGSACPDGAPNLGDPIYLDLDASGTVTTNDIKVVGKGSSSSGGVPTASGSSSWTTVTASDVDIGKAITAFGGYALGVFDANGDGTYGFGDPIYIDLNSDQMVNSGELRISKGGGATTSGTQVKPGDADIVYALNDLLGPNGYLAYDDVDNNNVVGQTEGLYLDMDGSLTVSVDDIRLAPSGTNGGTAGKQVISTDTDVGTALKVLPAGGFMYYNRNGGGFDAGDDLYVEVDGDANVEAGDLRVAIGSGGTGTAMARVTPSSTDAKNGGLPLTAIPGGAVLAYYDFNGGGPAGIGGYNRNDVAYLDVNADGVAEMGDVRLSSGPSPMGTAGQFLTDASSDAEYCFPGTASFTFPLGRFAFVDDNSNGVVNLEDTVYFDRDSTDGTLRANDVRLSGNSGVGAAGTFVKAGDSDVGNTLTASPAATGSFFDSNADGAWSGKGTNTGPDTAYLDFDASGKVSPTDLRLTKAPTGTSASAGSLVKGGDNDQNSNLAALPATTFAAIDSNGDGSFTSADALYINVDSGTDGVVGVGCVTPGDIRLSGSGSGSSGGGGGGTGGSGGGSTTSISPTVTFTTPTNGATVRTGNVMHITGTATAGTQNGVANDVSSVALMVNGDTVTVDGTTSWSADFTPSSDGSYELFATVTASSGQTGTRTITVTASATGGTTGGTNPPPSTGNEQIDALIAQITQLGTQLNQTIASNTQLQSQVASLNTQIGTQTTSLSDLQSKLAQTQADNAKLQQQLASRATNTTSPTKSPGFEPLVLLAALGAAVLVLRRR